MGNSLSRLGQRMPLKWHHITAATEFNMRALRNDRLFSGFLIGSGASLAVLLTAQIREAMSARRRSSTVRSSAASPPLGVGSEVETPYGRGKVVGERSSDKICTVELLRWVLSGGSSARVYISRERIRPVASPKKSKRRRRNRGKLFWPRLIALLKICVPSMRSREARLLAVQFGFLMLRSLITVRIFRLSTMLLTQAISLASWKHWARWLVNFSGWMGIGTLTNSALKYIEALLAIGFRTRLTQHIHKLYMSNKSFYRLATTNQPNKPSAGNLDHVDARISEDLRLFSTKLAHLYGHSFKPILEFLFIIGVTIKDLGAWRPFALFASLGVINGVLKKLGPNLSSMVAAEQASEGAFRHAHARVRQHAEAVAFLGGAAAEERILNASFLRLCSLRTWHALRKLGKDMADQFFKFQALLIGGVFVHVPFLNRPEMRPAERIAAFRATEVLMLKCGSAFGEVLLLGKSLDTIGGFTRRIAELLEALPRSADKGARALGVGVGADSEGSEQKQAPDDMDNDDEAQTDAIVFQGVTVAAPEPGGRTRTLVRDLTLRVDAGVNVLVTGPNGCGKTSLFRVLAGLWDPVEGRVIKPEGETVMWLPQNPYLVTGTLRDQVTYPLCCGSGDGDADVEECLRLAGLGTVLDRSPRGLDQISPEWMSELSGGERQRVGFARLFYHRPRFAVLDEATSAINASGELGLYKTLLSRTRCTVFSIAHRLALRQFHKLELEFAGDGSGAFTIRKLSGKAEAKR